jgi:hypothetical protein
MVSCFLVISWVACSQTSDTEVSSEGEPQTGWIAMAEPSFPALLQPSAVWTGSGMLVWGTTDPELPDVRARTAIYDPDSDQWRELPAGPLTPRFGQAAVWTGDELLVWGGGPRGGLAGDGARFSLDSETWTEMSPGPLGPRSFNPAVWTDEEMLIWGAGTEAAPDGAAYASAKDSWTVMANAPIQARSLHTAVWTGHEVLVWGGVRVEKSGETLLDNGAAYDPDEASWRKLNSAPLTPRVGHTAIWTGSEMLVWGGGQPPDFRADGAAYDPASDSWRELSDSPLDARLGHAAAWSGDKMFIWGGTADEQFADGALYDPTSDRWSLLEASPLDARGFPVGLWADEELLLWGGTAADGSLLPNGAVYRP